ncbi:MAG TPA: V-type ATPase 116kDa subunit family protein [Dehalococcoidia bacterium]|nr:V-type ATPase 116kDa subunit family protein [Dehalococcoidia bacterium]
MRPMIVNTPDTMVKVRVMTAKDYSNKTLKTLHIAGVLHVEQSEELKPADREAIEGERGQVTELLTAIDNVLAYIPKGEKVPLEEDVEVIYTRPFSETDSKVRLLCTKLSNMHQRVVTLNQQAEGLKELQRYLEPLEQQADLKLRDLAFSGDYLLSMVFVIPSEMYQTLYDKLSNYLFGSIVATIENETIFHIIAKTEDRKIIESTIKDNGGKILPIPDEDLALREFTEIASDKIHSLEEELMRLRGEIEGKTRENLEKLVLFREALRAENERLSVLEKACEAKYVTLIEGWIPESNVEATIAELKQNIDYLFIDTRKPRQEEEPPTKMRNPTALKPFQVIVNLFATPKYREWDPTPIVAYSFAFFFGLMLGDVAYAVLLILATKFALSRFVDDPESEGFKLFQRLLYISCGVALVVGLLTGTYLGNFYEFFGIESLALSEGVKAALGDSMTFIVFSLMIGIVHVNIAHVLALIKGIREGNKSVIPGKAGLFILQIAGIPWIMHNMLDANIPLLNAQAYSILLYAMLFGVILLVISSLMERGKFLGSIFWLFDITGLLGDVMSYCRLAGVGLATYYLAFCFNLMATLISGMIPAGPAGLVHLIGGTLIFIIILLTGHIINLVLAGITCFVHSLRLCFVEFLFKFYEGGGREYSPFRLRKRTLVPVKESA